MTTLQHGCDRREKLLHTMWLRRACLLGGLTATAIFAAGCGGLRVEYVEGRVTLDGKPVPRAIVQFAPKGEGRFAGGQTDSNGRYSLNAMGGRPGAGTPAGEYDVAIEAYEDQFAGMPERPSDPAKAEKWDQEMARRGMTPAQWLAPKEYAEVRTSGLSASVKPGKNTIDFDLKSDFKGAGTK
jgi:hypothetical protein